MSKESQNYDIDVISAFFAGLVCAALFNPWDRAMYLSSTKNVDLFKWENFTRPFHGFMQAIIQRAFVYLFLQAKLEHTMKPYLRDELRMSEPMTKFFIGLFAGGINGGILNPVIAIKHHTWGNEKRSFFLSVREMFSKGGYKSFLNGMHTSVIRGSVYGANYETSRFLIRKQLPDWNKPCLEFTANLIASGIGTMAASPFIFMRSVQHATPPGNTPPTMRALLENTWNESKNCPTFFKRVCFFPRRFRTFPGMAGAAMRMAVAQQICDTTRSVLSA